MDITLKHDDPFVLTRAAQQAFGLTTSQAWSAVRQEKIIRCRPDQYKRFKEELNIIDVTLNL